MKKVNVSDFKTILLEGGPGSGRRPGGGRKGVGPSGVTASKLISLANRRDDIGQVVIRAKSWNAKTKLGEKRYIKALGWMEKNAEKLSKGMKMKSKAWSKRYSMSASAKSKKYGPMYGD
jgi:hypothetical protein